MQGSHFRKLRDFIMGRVRCFKPKGDAVSTSETLRKKAVKKSKKKEKVRGADEKKE